MTTTTETIWKAFHKELFNFINKRVKDKDISKDILQDVFIKIHLKLKFNIEMQEKSDTPYKLILGTQYLISSKKKDKLEGIEFLSSLYIRKLGVFTEVIQQYKDELIQMLCSNDMELITSVLNLFEVLCINQEIWLYTYYSFLFLEVPQYYSFFFLSF